METATRSYDEPVPGDRRRRVLVIGATGYVGSRLIPALLDRDGIVVRAAARDREKLTRFPWHHNVDAVSIDVFDPETVTEAMRSVHVIYYLVHSMDGDDFVSRDRQAALTVAHAAEENGVERIVYLSGLLPHGPDELSDHLFSRFDVERVFTSSAVPAVTLRAAIILGAASASFELLRQLSERIPFVPLPRWLNSRVQPISVRDVVDQLIDVGLSSTMPDASIDVGGPTAMTYAELVATYCRITEMRRPFIPLPFIPHRFVGAMASHFVDLTPALVQALVDSLGHEMICRPDKRIARHGDITAEDAIRASLAPTASSDDPHILQPYDPDWAGGDIDIVDGRPRITGAATGGTGWRSRRTRLPVLAVAVTVAAGLTVIRLMRDTQPRSSPGADD